MQPRPISLRTIQLLIWASVLSACLVLSYIASEIHEYGYQSQIKAAIALSTNACEEIAKRFRHAVTENTFSPDKRDQFQAALLEIVLDRYEGIEGGFWSERKQFTAYAFPSYQGSGVKKDVPEAEKNRILSVTKSAIAKNATTFDQTRGQREATLVFACPINSTEAAWTLQRLSLGVSAKYDTINTNLLILIGLLLASTSLCSYLLYRWGAGLASTAAIINNTGSSTPLPNTENDELNRIVNFTNSVISQLSLAELKNVDQSARLSRSDRLRSLGEMSSGIAHDIRNPLSTIRLKLENLLVDPSTRASTAAPVIFEQIDRLDRMVEMILAMTRPFELQKEKVQIPSWMESHSSRWLSLAKPKMIAFTVKADLEYWNFDPMQLSRALNNIVENAISQTPSGGAVQILACEMSSHLIIEIKDNGPGIDKNCLPTLFQPFSSSRSGGTGLGLMLAREILEAHHGTISYAPNEPHGAVFKMELPS